MNVRSLFIDKLIDPSKHQLGIVRCNSKLEKMISPTNVPSNNTVDGNYCIASYILFKKFQLPENCKYLYRRVASSNPGLVTTICQTGRKFKTIILFTNICIVFFSVE